MIQKMSFLFRTFRFRNGFDAKITIRIIQYIKYIRGFYLFREIENLFHKLCIISRLIYLCIKYYIVIRIYNYAFGFFGFTTSAHRAGLRIFFSLLIKPYIHIYSKE